MGGAHVEVFRTAAVDVVATSRGDVTEARAVAADCGHSGSSLASLASVLRDCIIAALVPRLTFDTVIV